MSKKQDGPGADAPKTQKRSPKKLLAIGAVIILVILVSAVTYYFVNEKASKVREVLDQPRVDAQIACDALGAELKIIVGFMVDSYLCIMPDGTLVEPPVTQ